MGRDGAGRGGMGWDGAGRDGAGRDGARRAGTGWGDVMTRNAAAGRSRVMPVPGAAGGRTDLARDRHDDAVKGGEVLRVAEAGARPADVDVTPAAGAFANFVRRPSAWVEAAAVAVQRNVEHVRL